MRCPACGEHDHNTGAGVMIKGGASKLGDIYCTVCPYKASTRGEYDRDMEAYDERRTAEAEAESTSPDRRADVDQAVLKMHGAIQSVFILLNTYAKEPYGPAVSKGHGDGPMSAVSPHGVLAQAYAGLASQWTAFDQYVERRKLPPLYDVRYGDLLRAVVVAWDALKKASEHWYNCLEWSTDEEVIADALGVKDKAQVAFDEADARLTEYRLTAFAFSAALEGS